MIRLYRFLKEKGVDLTKVRHAVGMSEYDWRWMLHGTRQPGELEKARIGQYLQETGLAGSEELWRADAYPARPYRPRRVTQDSPALEVQAETEVEEKVAMLTNRESLSSDELTHFKLVEDPFDDLPGVEPWMGPVQRTVLQRLKKAVRNREIYALVGEVGCGKSTVLRKWMKELEGDPTVKLVIPAGLSRKDVDGNCLTHALVRALAPNSAVPVNHEKRSQMVRELLTASERAGVTPVLLIEEAHALPLDTFIALKDLWDRSDLFRLLSIVLVGQGNSVLEARTNLNAAGRDLGLKLRDVRIREFFQRARVTRMEPMDQKQIADYLTWRFKQVGGNVTTVFQADAFEALAQVRSCAFPLTLTNVAILAMRKAMRQGDERVTRGHITLMGMA